MDKQTEVIEEDGYVAIKWSEYKELLIIKGKYEELSKKPLITYNLREVDNKTLPYPQDLTPKYPYTTTCESKNSTFVRSDLNV